MTMEEVDQVLDTATKIKKITPHPEGTTVTVQHPGMPGNRKWSSMEQPAKE